MKRLGAASPTAVAVAMMSWATAALAQAGPAGAGQSTPAAAQSAPAAADAADDVERSTIIVTGTRSTGLRAVDSPAPIQLLSADALKRTGQSNLIQALAQTVPSFTAEGFGADTGNLTPSARLRGLNPNQTLLLINGKRRHGTANLHIIGGPYQGAASPDIDLIPSLAIKRIEILQDGAAAQYGSDAIAGVVNIVLADDVSGGTAQITGGQYYAGDGDTLSETARLAVPIGQDGYLDITGFHRFHDFSQRGGGDRRFSLPNGTLLSSQAASVASLPGYPRLNRILGDGRSNLTTAVVNAGYKIGDVELYGFGSYGSRKASTYANYRGGDRVSRTVNGATTLFAPNGFSPRVAVDETDYAVTGGAKGKLVGWNFDLSATYGRDRNILHTWDSANASLYADTGFTPTEFYDGAFIAGQFSSTLDFSKQFDIGVAEPLNIAFGGEYRRDDYEIRAGDAASIYKEGAQSYPGFQPTDAGKHTRHAESAYVDLFVKPADAWLIDLAARYEHFSDFGGKLIGKATMRYDFSDAFAVRGTVSNGFRAPTLAEGFYSSSIVSPSLAIVQLPPNSGAAAILGFQPLKPEKSTNFSAGFVTHPLPKLTLTLDAYQISIKDRIAITGFIFDTVDPRVSLAIAAHGNVLDPTATFRGVSVAANGIDTRTRGIELSLNYPSVLDFARIDWSLSGNYNRTKITKNKLGSALFNPIAESNIETASPRYKINFGALITHGPVSVNLRETIYGKATQLASPSNAAPFFRQTTSTAAITDIEIAYRPVKRLELAVGANNLFNKQPERIEFVPGTGSATTPPTLINGDYALVYDAPYTFSPYGINGGYYYTRAAIDF
jgi:iron complex outermembrane receptor protein